MISDADLLFLRRAVELAERGLYSVSGNPRVGCVIVRDGEVLGRGWHRRTGDLHAETVALEDAAARGRDVAGATAYVSLEPCCHHGRQPPCVDALVRAGIARVVSAMDDPDPRVAGDGYRQLRAAGIEVETRPLDAARELNAGFTCRLATGRPLVRVKVAASLDGRTALASGESKWITGESARADVQAWRARSCAVVTGIGTVLADDPALTVRERRFEVDGDIRQPLAVVADSRARTPAAARLFDADRCVILAAGAGAPGSHPKAHVHRLDADRPDLSALLDYLGGRGCNEVLVEAGARLAGAFFAERLWDEAIVYLAPKLLGSDGRPLAQLAVARLADALTGKVASTARVGDDIRVVISPRRPEPAATRPGSEAR